MIALDYLKGLPRSCLPRQVERGISDPSNGDLKRWLNMKAVIINDCRPTSYEEITFPITKLVFFPNGGRKTTLIGG